MSSIRFRISCAAIGLIAVAGCTDTKSATDLNPAGPPEIAQVRVREDYKNAQGVPQVRTVFAFGTHPMATPDDEHPVTTASPIDNKLRIIVDELLVGNNLEEIQCRGVVDSDAFSAVPVGDTPDDIARCAVPSDALQKSCPGSDPRSVCVCQNDGGCGAVAKGDPVGVLDDNQDGAADDSSFIQGAVGITCGPSSAPIDVPIDLDQSYWNPSGNQEVPAQGGFDALGPAIVLVPASVADKTGVLPTNMTCGLTFASAVVDKQNNQVCAPPDGDFRANDSNGCTPGDVSAFTFKTSPLEISGKTMLKDMDTDISTTDDLALFANAPLDPATAANVTLVTTTGGTPADVTVQLNPNDVDQIVVHPNTALANNTQYTLTIPTTVTDTFGQGMPAPVVIHFTTVP